MFPAAAHDIEPEFADDIDALHANIRAFNRWMYEEVGSWWRTGRGCRPTSRSPTPTAPLAELEIVMAQSDRGSRPSPATPTAGATTRSRPAGRPGVRPLLEHRERRRHAPRGPPGQHGLPEVRRRLVGGPRHRVLPDFDAFQWVMYWGDRPAMEITAGLILHNFFGRFPNLRACSPSRARCGCPTYVRKMDHAFLMGRKAKFSGHRPAGPAPEPDLPGAFHRGAVPRGERAARRLRGRDRAHRVRVRPPTARAWRDPASTQAQLGGFDDEQVKRIMRDNFEDFFVASL